MVTDEQLIGFALNLLDPAEQQAVELAIVQDPILASKLSRLNQALLPMKAAREPIVPPPGLALAAIAKTAEYVVAQRREVPVIEPRREPVTSSPSRSWPVLPTEPETDASPSIWRPMELLLAGCVAFLAVGLAAAGVQKIRHEQQVLVCQNQMRQVHSALSSYSQTENGRFPQVGTPTVPTAGEFAQELQRKGHLADVRLARCPDSAPTLPFAYTLGYRSSTGGIRGLTTLAEDWTPILADLPSQLLTQVSHSTGQNVLFVNGSARFCTIPEIGLNRDDIYVNEDKMPRAGLHSQDVSLGTPNAIP